LADPIVIDNSAFAKHDFRNWLKTYYGQKVFPSVAYSEALVHFLNKGGTPEKFNELLEGLRVQVEWTKQAQAASAAAAGSAHGDWTDNARDYLIGAHAEDPPRIMITENVEDFSHLPRVVDVWDAVQGNL
jgi:predicted nucleic acid-binding protein